MKIAWTTDCHLEWLNQKSRKIFFEAIADEHPDVVLLGGDICNFVDLEPWLLKLHKIVQVPIFFCLGNHDYYNSSIYEVRELSREITKNHDQISWLPARGVVQLNDDIGLIGHDCWGDGRAGSFYNSPLSLNDFRYIKDLSGLRKHDQLEQIGRLGSEAADYLEFWAEKAAKSFEKVVVLTHVPPFANACLYMGQQSVDGLPFFCAKAAGDALIKVASNNPQTQFLVLSGHTHDAAEVEISDNLHIIVAGADYGRPQFKMLDLGKLFFVIQDKTRKLATLRQALIEGEKSGFTECSLDEINRELDIEFARNELLEGKGERRELLKGESPDPANDAYTVHCSDEQTKRAISEVRKGLSEPIDDLLELINEDFKVGEKMILEEKWLKENKDAIVAFNNHIGKNGIFSSKKRRF